MPAQALHPMIVCLPSRAPSRKPVILQGFHGDCPSTGPPPIGSGQEFFHILSDEIHLDIHLVTRTLFEQHRLPAGLGNDIYLNGPLPAIVYGQTDAVHGDRPLRNGVPGKGRVDIDTEQPGPVASFFLDYPPHTVHMSRHQVTPQAIGQAKGPLQIHAITGLHTLQGASRKRLRGDVQGYAPPMFFGHREAHPVYAQAVAYAKVIHGKEGFHGQYHVAPFPMRALNATHSFHKSGKQGARPSSANHVSQAGSFSRLIRPYTLESTHHLRIAELEDPAA